MYIMMYLLMYFTHNHFFILLVPHQYIFLNWNFVALSAMHLYKNIAQNINIPLATGTDKYKGFISMKV